MKKRIFLLLAAWMLFALAACGTAPAPVAEQPGEVQGQPAATPEAEEPAAEAPEEPAEAEEPAAEAPEEPAPAAAADGDRQVATAHLDQREKCVDVMIDLSGGWSVEFAYGAFYLYDPGYSEDRESSAIGLTLSRQVYREYCAEAAEAEDCRELDGALYYTGEDGYGNYLISVDDEAFLLLAVTPGQDCDAVFSRVHAERGFDWNASIDYLALVNKCNALPEDWENLLDTVHITNSLGDDVEAESRAYIAYLKLARDLAENDGIYIELDSARRSVADQQDIMDRFTEKYGADYAAKTVAQPGYSEHHTGLALDLYFKIKNEDGSFTDVYYNEDMEKEEYKGIWDTIHAKLPEYGFILRYLEGEEHITGYRYEPWHIRYVDDAGIAQAIMSEPGLTLEEYLAGQEAPEVEIDLSGSALYTEEELYDAMLAVKCAFAAWDGCELHAIRYAGDEANSEENISWLNSLEEGTEYVQALELLTDYHTAADIQGTWNPDEDYTDYQWWLARTEGGDWEIVSYGY